ncbi:MAG: hypothetical protein WBA16_03825 [Nonlabens sp.]
MVGEEVHALNELIADSKAASPADLDMIEQIRRQFPYFQAIAAVHLKVLKEENSPLYNEQLKKVAAITTDRGVLFDYITSPLFTQDHISDQITEQVEELENSESIENHQEIQSTPTPPVEDLNCDTDFTGITRKDLFQKKVVETPFEFTKNEEYSFSQWLRLTTIKPIDAVVENQIESTTRSLQDELRLERMKKVDRFLADQPKIKPSRDKQPAIELSLLNSTGEQLMTETLAQVYVAQKNYVKAIKSYEILALQHPEKSGFFADRIQEVKNLQKT